MKTLPRTRLKLQIFWNWTYKNIPDQQLSVSFKIRKSSKSLHPTVLYRIQLGTICSFIRKLLDTVRHMFMFIYICIKQWIKWYPDGCEYIQLLLGSIQTSLHVILVHLDGYSWRRKDTNREFCTYEYWLVNAATNDYRLVQTNTDGYG